MHALELADLAGTFVRFNASGVPWGTQLESSVQQSYWITARCRHDAWMRALSEHRDAIAQPGTSRRARHWHAIIPCLQEILLSEPLSRVVAYHAQRLHDLGVEHDFAALANSVLAAHVEARHRCLHLIVFGAGLPVEHAVGFNRLRRNLESYTDQLLGCLPALEHWGLYCFEPQQVARRQAAVGREPVHSAWATWHTLRLAEELRLAARGELDWRAATPRLNNQLSQQVLRFTPASGFDGVGVPLTPMHARLQSNSPEAAPTPAPGGHPLFSGSVFFSHRPHLPYPLRRRS